MRRVVQCKTSNLLLSRDSKNEHFSLKVNDLLLDSNPQTPLKLPLIGRSGSGKSTLLEALASMLTPQSGSIYWTFDDIPFNLSKEQPLSEKKVSLLRSKYFGFAFQDTTLTPFLTVLDNLLYPQYLINTPKDYAIKNAKTLINKVFHEDTEKIMKKYPCELSGGQRQRISLIQAMCNDPYVLFADEPTGSLDHDTRQEVMEVVSNWQTEKGGMFLWVTHHRDDYQNIDQYIQVDNETPNNIAKMVYK